MSDTKAAPAPPEPLTAAFAPVPVRPRRDGWTAARQRRFIETLAETGCVATAAGEAGLTARSAYRLAARADAAAFAEAWDHAMAIASRRLAAIAFSYATHGLVETVTGKDGAVVGERRRPSERILLYLLGHLDPYRLGPFAVMSSMKPMDTLPSRRHELARLSGAFADVDPSACPAERAPARDPDPDDPQSPARA